MTDQKLRLLIGEAVRLDRAIARLQDKLKAIKGQIATEAETRGDEAEPTEGGGTSITLEGTGGCIARVTETGRALKALIKPEDKAFPKIKEAAGGSFSRLFTPEVVHKPVDKFREQARELLGEVPGNKLIRLCENPGKTTVSFETKETPKPAAAE